MEQKLEAYRRKRNFLKTSEPSGKEEKPVGVTKRKIFAVQLHYARTTHFDFRLEWDGVLLSWAVPKGPSFNPKDKRLAVRVEEHPLDYADFEGVIPKGEYGGGTVLLWDKGYWTETEDFARGLEKGSLKLRLDGKRLKGGWALVRLNDKDKAEDEKENWLLFKEKDSFAKDTSGLTGRERSVKSGLSAKGIAEKAAVAAAEIPFDCAPVMLCRQVAAPPSEKGWVYEIKYDGYRIAAYSQKDGVRLLTRNGKDFSDKLPELAQAIGRLSNGRALVLDGEAIISDDEGRSDFQALQNHLRLKDGRKPVYMVFDLLSLDGKDLRELPLIERKKRLKTLIGDGNDAIKYSAHVEGRGEECFAAARKLGLEGIVGKRADSPYSGSRNGDWIKIKCYNRQEFVIGGFTRTAKRSDGVSALLLGYFEDGSFVYAGRAGTGFGAAEARKLLEIFRALKTDKCPFSQPPDTKGEQSVFWLKPRAVAEIQFAEWTDENVLRQASYKGLRADKEARSVVRETARTLAQTDDGARKTSKSDKDSVLGVKISNPQRLVFASPILTKKEVAEYYAAAAERMLKYAGGRIVSVVRCHGGVSDACFFKKHPTSDVRGTGTATIKSSDGKASEYFYLKNEIGLISEVQLGTVEFHVWGSRVSDLEKPDMLVFDLDPDEGLPAEKVRQGARDVKKVLDALGLKSFLKVSGGKGYHIVVPLLPEADWETASEFARRVAETAEKKWPDRYTSNIRKEKRKGKIFIDWARNGRGSTGVAPYSLRARAGAKVSMPIAWKELDSVLPSGVTVFDALKRLKAPDPWKGFFNVGQSLKKISARNPYL